jgi:hypothetical protein
MKSAACATRVHVDAHFAGTVSPEDERAMRAHIPTCNDCRGRYRRHLLLAKLDPEAPPAEVRIAKGLGLERRASTRDAGRFFWPAAGLVAAAASLALLFRAPAPPDGFVARGGGQAGGKTEETAPPAVLHVYSVPPGKRALAPVPVVSSVRRDDALAFAIENRDAKKYVMIFGVNESGRVYWFYPAWREETENPRAIEIATDANIRELPDAVTHHFQGTSLRVHALFLDEPKTVRDIEGMTGAGASPLTIPNATDHVMTFTVTP